jgi:4-hydroxy-tetrahydrodipicolinate reductase
MMDTIPVFASTVCNKVEGVQVHRIQDATTRRLPFQRKIGATLDREAFARGVGEGWLRHVGLGESLHFVAHYLGLPFDRWEESIEPVIASTAMTCGIGAIPAGHAAGVLQLATGYRGSTPVVQLVFQAAIGQANPHDRVVITGEPNLDLTFTGGVHGDVATSAMTLNAIQSLLAAPPGLHTSATVPLLRLARGG